MNLHGATSATPDDVRQALTIAITRAAIIQQSFADGEETDERISPAFAALRRAIERVGEDDFEKPNIPALLGDKVEAKSDWPLYVIANAMEYCDASAKNGDGGAQSGMDSIASGLARLGEIHIADIVVTNALEKVAWTDEVRAAIVRELTERGITGRWSVIITEMDHTLILWHHAVGSGAQVHLGRMPGTVRIDGTEVLEAEAEAFRAARRTELIAQMANLVEQLEGATTRLRALE